MTQKFVNNPIMIIEQTIYATLNSLRANLLVVFVVIVLNILFFRVKVNDKWLSVELELN